MVTTRLHFVLSLAPRLIASSSPWVVFLAPVWQRLELLDGYLSEFDASGADTSGSKVKWQQKKKTPWMVKEEFPAGEDSKGEQQRGRRIAL